MTKVFEGESWYEGEKSPITQRSGTLSKLTTERQGFGRNYQYVLILSDGDSLPIYSGGDIQTLTDFVGQEVKISGKYVSADHSIGFGITEIWPGEIEVVRDGVTPGREV